MCAYEHFTRFYPCIMLFFFNSAKLVNPAFWATHYRLRSCIFSFLAAFGTNKIFKHITSVLGFIVTRTRYTLQSFIIIVNGISISILYTRYLITRVSFCTTRAPSISSPASIAFFIVILSGAVVVFVLNMPSGRSDSS